MGGDARVCERAESPEHGVMATARTILVFRIRSGYLRAAYRASKLSVTAVRVLPFRATD